MVDMITEIFYDDLRKRKPSWKLLERNIAIHQLRNQGLTYRAIGEIVGVSKSRTWYIFKQFEQVHSGWSRKFRAAQVITAGEVVYHEPTPSDRLARYDIIDL